VAAQAGDIVELFGVGFGPTTPTVPAGRPFVGAAPTKDPVSLYINNVVVQPAFVGLSSAGLYQINLTVPAGLGEGDVPIRLIVGGLQTQPFALFSLLGATTIIPGTGGSGGTAGIFPPPGFTTVPPPGFTTVNPGTGGTGGGNGGATDGGTGGGSAAVRRPYEPRLRFDQSRKYPVDLA
jgi:hypothetical protein